MEIWQEGDQELRHATSEENNNRTSVVWNRYYGTKSRREANKVRVRYPKILLYLIVGCIITFLVIDYVSEYTGKAKKGFINNNRHIQKINKREKSYYIKANQFFESVRVKQANVLFKNEFSKSDSIPYCKNNNYKSSDIPYDYNFYDKYRKCKTNDVQRKCSSNYVEIHTSVYKARLCTKDVDMNPSVDYLLNCDTQDNKGCDGGYLMESLEFAKKHGYIDKECWNNEMGDEKKCPAQEKLKNCRKFYLSNYCVLTDKLAIQNEIMENGPVIGQIDPYIDFLLYEEGMFDYSTKDKIEGNEFIKVVGWGKEGNTEYWLVESMWGKTWGVNGLAKVIMGDKKDKISKETIAIYPAEIAKEYE